MPNAGSPVPHVRDFLTELYDSCPGVKVIASGATGYGEDLGKTAFRLDCGVVETMAHLIAARNLQPGVDFIIDIGGQDIKCFKIRGGAVDRIMLNEAIFSRKASPLTQLVEETEEPLSRVGAVQAGKLNDSGWCSKGFLYAWN